MLGDQRAQQVAVDGGMARHERRAEAGREGRLRFGAHALLGAGDLGGVAREEVVHRLARRQLGDGRQHAEGIRRQHDDVLRVAGASGRARVRDVFERVGRAGVLGEARVVVVGHVAGRFQHHVLEHGCPVIRRAPDGGLGVGREADRLGVAAALEIEDALLRPAVLVVAEQSAFRIGRERRLAGAGQAEEHGRVALLADVGRAVHRHHRAGRERIIEI